jgi:hypothetical protein
MQAPSIIRHQYRVRRQNGFRLLYQQNSHFAYGISVSPCEILRLIALKGFVKPKYFDQNVLDWLVKMSPSLEDFTGWGAHWVLTQGVFSGVRFPTLKRLISKRGLTKIREQHDSLLDWYMQVSKFEGPNPDFL